jgi:hypothetical protein
MVDSITSFFEVVLVIFIVYLVFAITILIICSVKQKKRLSAFIKENPDYVKLRVLTQSCSSRYTMIIFSVNDKQPLMKNAIVYLPVGTNKIIAHFITEDNSQRMYPLANFLVHGLGTFLELIASSKRSKKIKAAKPENAITINFETKINGKYEMKADPYKDEIIIICLEGEKHAVKSFR